MGMTVKRRRDSNTQHVFMHKVADVRGGVSVSVSNLGGQWLHEGTVISAPVNGMCYVVKTGYVAAAVEADATTITLKKGHHFVVGDVILLAEGSIAVTISAIDTSASGYDTLTLSATLGAIDLGTCVAQAATETTGTDSALLYTPFAVVGTGKPVISGDNINTDAWLIGVTKGNYLPDCVTAYLTGIINYD